MRSIQNYLRIKQFVSDRASISEQAEKLETISGNSVSANENIQNWKESFQNSITEEKDKSMKVRLQIKLNSISEKKIFNIL